MKLDHTVNKKMVYVPTGDLHSAGPGEVLCSGPLGSCVAVLIFDRKTGRGFMAHIMLPGKKTDCFANDGHDLKYAENAINALAALLRKENPNFLLDCETCVVGGANVLQKGNDRIPTTIHSIYCY